jgi:hypothetical protein
MKRIAPVVVGQAGLDLAGGVIFAALAMALLVGVSPRARTDSGSALPDVTIRCDDFGDS